MNKIKFSDFMEVLKYDVIKYSGCSEVHFKVEDSEEFNDCWMGKTPNREDKNKELYWYGLKRDGSAAYDYEHQEEFISAKVFNGKSLIEMWDCIELIAIDMAGTVEERIEAYKNFNRGTGESFCWMSKAKR